jgi:hypothetical protein
MKWQITYYNEKVIKIIGEWPIGMRAFYARLAERIKLYGPNLGMPFTRAMGAFVLREKKVLGVPFFVLLLVAGL